MDGQQGEAAGAGGHLGFLGVGDGTIGRVTEHLGQARIGADREQPLLPQRNVEGERNVTRRG